MGDSLHTDVGKARTRGVGNVEKPLVDLPALLWAARIIGGDEPEIEDDDKIEYALRLAVARLGGQSALAIEALFGLSQLTRDRSTGIRRGSAAKIYGKKPEYFRAHFEMPLLMALATNLRVLVDERRLADVRAELQALLTKNQDLPTPSLLDLDEDWEDEPVLPWQPLISSEDVAKMMEKQRRETYLQLF